MNYFTDESTDKHTNILEMNEPRRLFVCGDIHGEFGELVAKLCDRKITESVVIVAGDSGLGFYKQAYYENELGHFSQRLAKNNNWILLLRGNHDDPAYYAKQTTYGRFIVIPDYTIVKTVGRTILCIGGAISVDRRTRINQQKLKGIVSYWEKEPPFYSDALFTELKDNGIKIDTVVTHTSPSFCEFTDKSGIDIWAEWDNNLYADVEKERATMDMIFERLKADQHPVTSWLYGHFHWNVTEKLGDIEYSMLGICEIKELQ